MSKTTLRISFPEANHREASAYAKELRRIILDAFPEVDLVIQPSDPNAQSLGTEILLAFIADLAVKSLVKIHGTIRGWWSGSAAKPKTVIATDDQQPPIILGDRPEKKP